MTHPAPEVATASPLAGTSASDVVLIRDYK